MTLIPPQKKNIEDGSQLRTETEDDTEDESEDVPIPDDQVLPLLGTGVKAVDFSVKSKDNPFPPPVQDKGICGSCYAFGTLSEMSFATSMQKKV